MNTFLKKSLLFILFLGCMVFWSNSNVFAQEINSNIIENTLNEYFHNEWRSIKNNTINDSSNIILNNNFKNYYDNYISTRVEWYNSINKKLQDYTIYMEIENIQYDNNEYIVNVNVGHDLIFSDCSDTVQKMRDEQHIIILAYENNSLKIKNDFKDNELAEHGYSIKDIDISTLNKIREEITKNKTDFILECKENIKLETLNYNVLKMKSVKSNLLAEPKSSYNRQAAVNYAAAHYNDTPKYTADCTNFVSNCLKAGGLATTPTWKPDSSAWINVQLFYDYMVTASNRASEVSWSSSLGDIVQFGTNSINWHHSTIITYVRPTTGEIFLSSHSKPRYNYAYSNYFGTYSTSRFIHIY